MRIRLRSEYVYCLDGFFFRLAPIDPDVPAATLLRFRYFFSLFCCAERAPTRALAVFRRLRCQAPGAPFAFICCCSVAQGFSRR